MLTQQIAQRYAHALFDLAKERNLINQAWEQLNALADYLRRDKTFLEFMSAPQIPGRDKMALLKKAFKSQLERPFFDFLMLLAEKHRIKFLPEIIEEFDRLVRAERGIGKATCITTFKISNDERARLIEKLAQKTTLKIELEEKIDKAIMGGIIIILHNKIIDGSVRQALSLLRNRLMKVKVH